jgi:hypothetical protein
MLIIFFMAEAAALPKVLSGFVIFLGWSRRWKIYSAIFLVRMPPVD